MKKSMSMPIDRAEGEETMATLKHTASLPSLGSSIQNNKEKPNKQKVNLVIPPSPPATLKHTAILPSLGSSVQPNKEKPNKQKVNLEIPLSPPANSEKIKAPKARSLVKSPSSMMLLSYLNKAHTNQSSSQQKVDRPQHKPRSKSPLPSVVPSDIFMEARTHSQRFTSPPPERVGSEKSVYGKSMGRELSDTYPSADWCSTPVLSDKHKSRKGAGRSRVSAVDSMRGRRVSMAQAVQTTVDWTLDPSKMLVGHRFASGAHSRIYRGFYDDKPVAIKFIRQPDNDVNGKIATMLEKQYNTEINALSHLYHKNVIKVTISIRRLIMYCFPMSVSVLVFSIVFTL
jgi:hypothetical protein